MKKCPYCDFNSHSTSRPLDQAGYIEALIRDLDYERSLLPADLPPLHSIFFGGGTPSLFAPDSFDKLIRLLRERLPFDSSIEITMEANPGTTEYAAFGDYRSAGINRLSLGIQSFNNISLQALGRIHNADQAKIAYEKARLGGFDNINIDLMYGLPRQSQEGALADLGAAVSLGPEHISLYQLTLEPNTVFHRYPPKLPDPDQIIDQQVALQEKLEAADYEQYEVSAYCRPGKQSRHNLNYWRFGDYLGIGAGAHGKFTDTDKIVRRARKKHPSTWLQLAGSEDALASTEIVAEEDRLGEFMMNALRLRQGFEYSLPLLHADLDEETISKALKPSVENGLVEYRSNTVRCTERGYLFLDSILETLI